MIEEQTRMRYPLYKNARDQIELPSSKSINEFSHWDSNSETSRYPIDQKGNPSVLTTQLANIKSLHELIEKISYLLDGISDGISEYLNAKR